MTRTKGTIIMADDDGAIRSLFDHHLRRFFPEHYLDVLSDGISLEERLKRGTDGVVLVVTDNRMPGKHGSQIIEKYARKIAVPFILFYAGEESIGRKAEENGAFAYVAKLGGGIQGLVRTMREALTYFNAQRYQPTASSQ